MSARNDQAERKRWNPSGPAFRAELADTEKMFCVNNKMVPESQLQPAQEDPELYGFLFERQKAGLKPDQDGLRIVGGDPRDPDVDELRSVVGRVCPFCGQVIEEDEVTVSDMGSLVFYGPDVWHWEHLALMALLKCHGHYLSAAEKYVLPLEDLKAMRTLEFRSLSWGRLGYVRGGQ
ncbi:MAG: hypothetical protein QUS09_04070 [Methanotrichaceae archaeon]|nr:hypothetical protein [Methanotrichaceae archaeon]